MRVYFIGYGHLTDNLGFAAVASLISPLTQCRIIGVEETLIFGTFLESM